MKATATKMALMLGVLVLTASCTNTSNTPSTTVSQGKVSEVSNSETTIKIDGSSTVYPITQAVTKEFQQQNQAEVKVDVSGTTGGFERFCKGETDISNASRPILKQELKTCTANGVIFTELPIAFDALTVAVNPQNTWAKEITVAELKKIWEPSAQGKITNWKQVRASFPDKPLSLYGAGDKSGTYDYFTKAVVGESGDSRSDYTASEDDEVLVSGVSKDSNALGYFGYAYYEQNQDKLKALGIDNGKGAVLPSRETVEKAEYQPLSRPLFIYVNIKSAQKKAGVRDFVNFYIEKAPTTVSSVGYVPLPEDAYSLDKLHFTRGKAGTVFEGQARLDLTIDEVLRKRAEF
ncbi:phosphate ABC transporter substrate-binding protein, PhoT family [Rivularia sp. PCC 7116]|jgi:phosphate transport system substrate-binding protein|uniref:PstS family phosphate ABC transporter substrate-binding protein n=1 Tax=Rivularia sp. PCC 7116 TaxID=373994 RepID=UPI00029F35C3|nr:PstS family phosphate ABC transporter substrate-binding protein [Rivularia sp. PCC 7116]AFY54334.1 phosphate ABC transporter substrate-binding protein, PhoT family [Rivularia sp. PCC 7116]